MEFYDPGVVVRILTPKNSFLKLDNCNGQWFSMDNEMASPEKLLRKQGKICLYGKGQRKRNLSAWILARSIRAMSSATRLWRSVAELSFYLEVVSRKNTKFKLNLLFWMRYVLRPVEFLKPGQDRSYQGESTLACWPQRSEGTSLDHRNGLWQSLTKNRLLPLRKKQLLVQDL